MKKVLFFIFALLFGFSVASAKTIQVAADFDYNDGNTFNVFYEFKYNTKIAQFLASHFDLIDIYYDYFTTSSQVQELNYISSNSTDYYIQIRKVEGNYYFELNFKNYSRYSYYKYTIVLDENCNYVSSSQENNPNFSKISFTTRKRISIAECYDLFSYWQGNYDIYMTDNISYSLEAYYDDGNKYTNSNMDGISSWQLFWKSVYSYFDKGNEDDIENGVNLSYFSKHLIISQYVPLAFVKNAFFNIPDFDLSGYKSFFLNEVEEGALLVPIYDPSSTTDVDTNLYFYSSQPSGNFFSTALNVNEPDEKNSNYTLGDNYEFLNKDYFFYNTIINLKLEGLFTKISKDVVSNYAYHFFTTTYNSQIIIYYNPSYFDLIPAGSNTSAKFQNKGYLKFEKSKASDSWNNLNNDVGGILGSLGNINPSYSGTGKPSGNGSASSGSSSSSLGSFSDFTKKYSPSNIFESLGSVISMMGLFITEFLASMPKEISFCLTFFLPISLAIGIYRIAKG